MTRPFAFLPQRSKLPAPLVLGAAFLAGSIPFDNLTAHLVADSDLREVGTGTVSGSSLFEVAGFAPLAVSGLCDLGKGALGPLLAGGQRPILAASAAGAAVVGHDWSPLLGGAGGRGISPSLGALVVTAPEGVVILGGSLGVGRVVHHSAEFTLAGALALFPALWRSRGRPGLVLAAAMVLPMLTKRLAGNDGRAPQGLGGWWSRLVLDRDPKGSSRPPARRMARRSPKHRRAP